MGRIALGYSEFNIFSRWIPDYLSRLIHTNSFLTDISPFTQIISTLIISISSFLVILIFKNNKRITLWNIIAVIPFGLSPYFLACLSYKYDSPYMALSILSSIIPVLFYKFGTHSNKCMAMIVATGIMISASSYQASLGIFPLMIILLCFEKWIKNEPISNIVFLIIHSSISYIIGTLAYRFLLMQPFQSYASSSIFSLKELPLGILNNIKIYLTNVINDFDIKQIIAICTILLSFILLATFNSNRNKAVTFFVAIFTVSLSIAISFGVYLALDNPIFLPRAMFGFSICIAAIAVMCTTFKFSEISKVASFILSYCMLIFSFVYSNALQEQTKYTDNRMSMICDDLKDLPEFNTDNIKDIQMIKNEKRGISPIVKNLPQYDEVLGRMIPTWSNTRYFYYFYDLPNTRLVGFYGEDTEVQSINLKDKNLPVLVENNYYIIYGDKENILIEWKD